MELRDYTHTGSLVVGSGLIICIHMVSSGYNCTFDSIYHI